jgi:putative hydrolase of the HAD superfamily
VDFTSLFIDLDDTLYPPSSGLWQAIRERISLYMHERLHISREQIPELRRTYFETYGTALRGLEIHHQVDRGEYLAYVHDLPLRDYLRPDPALRRILLDLPGRRFILTNADEAHARRVLAALDLDGCFEAILDVHAMAPYCKPMVEAFTLAMRAAGESDPARCLIADDQPATTRAARRLGWYAVLVGPGQDASGQADAALSSLHDLPGLLESISRPAVRP